MQAFMLSEALIENKVELANLLSKLKVDDH